MPIIYSPLLRILLFNFFKIKTLASAINYYNLVASIAEARVSRYHSASLYFSRNISSVGPIRPRPFTGDDAAALYSVSLSQAMLRGDLQ